MLDLISSEKAPLQPASNSRIWIELAETASTIYQLDSLPLLSVLG